ncbi:MAG: nitroreductase family protein [Nanoarchaeota archaeon]|nr:nitroreductase family protein [Nanoarchaeota archaeon]
MEVQEAIRKRRSVRKYLDKPLPWEYIGRVLDAARLAPSSGNIQNWKFIVVTDPSRRKKIAEACLQQRWMEVAPVHIVVCAEPKKAIQFYGIRGDRLYSIQNCAAAIENMLLTATDMDIGACWIGAFDEGMLKSAASIQEEARPQAVVTLGYYAEYPKEPVHYTIENVAFMQRWGSRIADIDAVMGNYGNKLQRHIANAQEIANVKKQKLSDQIKNKIKEQIDKRKQARDEKEFFGPTK